MNHPLYIEVQEYIMKQISKGIWPVNHRIPSERELAEQFHVSRITAKTAIMGLVHRGLLVRHRGKGTFVANAEPMVKGVSDSSPNLSKKLIGFIIPWVEFRYSSLLLAGVESVLSEQGYHVLFKRVKWDETETKAIRECLEIPVDGMIIATCPGEQFDHEIIRLVLNRFPVVLVEKTVRDIQMNSVFCETERVGALMANYLLDKGCRELGLITYPTSFTFGVKERIFGFQAALVNRAVKPLPSEQIMEVNPEILLSTDLPVPVEFIRFIEQHPELDGIAAVDAHLARGIGKACALAGRRDIRFICCDEPSYDPNGVFPSAYIDQAPLEMGRISARLLLDAISGGNKPRKEVIAPKLIDFDQSFHKGG